jgi:hypothetical protein
VPHFPSAALTLVVPFDRSSRVCDDWAVVICCCWLDRPRNRTPKSASRIVNHTTLVPPIISYPTTYGPSALCYYDGPRPNSTLCSCSSLSRPPVPLSNPRSSAFPPLFPSPPWRAVPSNLPPRGVHRGADPPGAPSKAYLDIYIPALPAALGLGKRGNTGRLTALHVLASTVQKNPSGLVDPHIALPFSISARATATTATALP